LWHELKAFNVCFSKQRFCDMAVVLDSWMFVTQTLVGSWYESLFLDFSCDSKLSDNAVMVSHPTWSLPFSGEMILLCIAICMPKWKFLSELKFHLCSSVC
jgi:hypothetical protein